MKVNWVEAVWVNSPFRTLTQLQEIAYFRRAGGPAPGGRMLEIGCGRGAGVALVRRAFAPSRIDAIDIDPAMMRLAERRKRRGRMAEVELRVADAQALPYPDACMDAVFNFGIIHHLEDWRSGIREIARVSNPAAPSASRRSTPRCTRIASGATCSCTRARIGSPVRSSAASSKRPD